MLQHNILRLLLKKRKKKIRKATIYIEKSTLLYY